MAADPVTPTRARDLLLLAAGAALLSWALFAQVYGSLPKLHWFVPLSLALLAVGEAITGTQLRARIRHKPGTTPVHPLAAARSLALAKASSQVAAVMVGVWGGLLLYTVPKRDYLAAANGDTTTGLLGVLSSSALVAAALWLEYCCRAPKPPDEQEKRTWSNDADPNGPGLVS